MALPAWAPSLAQVAGYVPHRTLVRADASIVASQDTYQFTFDQTTIPTADQVTQLIGDGCTWMTAIVAPLNPMSEPMAGLLAGLWAAIAVERGWPEDDTSLQRASDMEKRLDTLTKALIASNTAANTQDGVAYPTPVLPQWSFPPSGIRWDSTRYW